MTVDNLNRVIECVSSEDFLRRVENQNIRIFKRNKDLMRFVASHCSVPLDFVTEHWPKIYDSIRKMYSGSGKKHSRARSAETGFKVNTLANSIFLAVYEAYGEKTPRVMYEVLEPFMMETLSGKSPVARLLFLPITPRNLDEVVSLLRVIVSSRRDVFCSPVVSSRLTILCRLTSDQHHLVASNCASKVLKVVEEVCGNA